MTIKEDAEQSKCGAQEKTADTLIWPCIGIDIGTSSISAVSLDLDTGILTGSYTIVNDADLPSHYPWEKCQDVSIIVTRIEELMEELLRQYPGICAIGITGQMHGIVYIDSKGNAASPLYTWQDERASIGQPSPCRILSELSGCSIPSGYGLATHFALMKNGEVPPDAVQFCTVMDYIVMNLCGKSKAVTHISNAAGIGLYRIKEKEFNMDAIRRAGMDVAMLPSVTSRCEIVGTYRGIPVSVAIGDNQASFLGSVREPRTSALANFGTGSQISVMVQPDQSPLMDEIMEIRPFLGDTCLYSGSALCGGRAYALLERFFRGYASACGIPTAEQYEIMNKLAEKGLQEENMLKIRTTFCGTRSNPTLRGSITDISEDNFTAEAMISGTLWGMASELYEMFCRIPHDHIHTMVVSGNAVRKNPAFQHILQKVFDMEVLIPAHKEEAAFGAAMFGAVAAGCASNFEQPAACINYNSI